MDFLSVAYSVVPFMRHPLPRPLPRVRDLLRGDEAGVQVV